MGKTTVVKCGRRTCFQNDCKVCKLLIDDPSQPCPFYKTAEQAEKDKKRAHDRLVKLIRFDLIEKYENNRYRKGAW